MSRAQEAPEDDRNNLKRTFTGHLTRAEGDEDSRKFRLSFSSEDPYDRWFGPEILDHAEGAVDLSRLNSIGVVLFNHNANKVMGKILRAWVENNRGEAEIEFDSDDEAELIYQKVKSGTLKGVSVGYIVDRWEEVMPGKQSADGRFTGPCSIARKWSPMEISIVSVPADATVGVGRSRETSTRLTDTLNISIKEVEKMNEDNLARQAEEAAAADTVTVETNVTQDAPQAEASGRSVDDAEIRAQERERIRSIEEMCGHFGIEARSYIDGGASVDAVRRAVMEQLIANRAPVQSGVRVAEDEGDKFRRAAADGLMMKAGLNVEKPEDGAKELRGMSLRDLAIECLSRDGESAGNLIRKSTDELFEMVTRQFYNPSAAFPAIMDQTIRKSIVELYNAVPTTFQQFTTKGSLPDFKESADHEYVIGGVGDFLEVPENGEIKADMPRTELLPTRKLKTYGKQFSMTRQAFVNDDIGFLTRVPGLYATAAKKTIDKQVYSILFNNPAIFDGVALFHANHKNLVENGSKPSQASIQEIILQMQKQTDQFGEAIYINPRSIVLPVGYEFDMAVILHSTQVTGSANNDINPLYNYPLQVVQSPVLNALAGANACPWFMFADATSARGIQVDYLNGQETPTVRRSEVPGTLGFVWDIWLDWGIAVRDFRGIAKNPGVQI